MWISWLFVEKSDLTIAAYARKKEHKPFACMADLNKFHRSRERLAEILHQLTSRAVKDESTHLFIIDLKKSLMTLDLKMEEFERKQA